MGTRGGGGPELWGGRVDGEAADAELVEGGGGRKLGRRMATESWG